MKRTRIVLIGIPLMELALAGIWYALATRTLDSPEGQIELGETFGGAMGIVAGVGLTAFVFHWMRERKAAG